jgi:serine/threonine protein kinase
MTLKIDQRLQQGRYRIRDRLGQGGMGTVYLAEDLNLSARLVAIKENTDTSPEAQIQFQREAVLLASLTHPNLPRVTDHFIEPSGRQYLVMDYVQGDDLRDLLQEQGGPLPESVVLGWIDQVMSALEYMHNWVDPHTRKPNPMIHRDIKPGNIKRTLNGRVVLVDFGLAKFAEGSVTIQGARAVTPGYSPIEQYTGGTSIRSDIYGLGATLYALVTGQKPPEAPAIAAGTTLPSPRKVNPNITRTTERVILRAMQIQPAERYANVQEMRAALFNKRGTKRLTDRSLAPFVIDEQQDQAPATRKRRLGVSFGISALLLFILLITGGGLALIGANRFAQLLNFGVTSTPTATIPLTMTPHEPESQAKVIDTDRMSAITATATLSVTALVTVTENDTLTPTLPDTPVAAQRSIRQPCVQPIHGPQPRNPRRQ